MFREMGGSEVAQITKVAFQTVIWSVFIQGG